jgi:hypothetical protein
MTAIVSAELAEQAWQRVGALDASKVLTLQNRSGGFQPELVGFVLGFTSELSPAGMGIALYAMLVVFEMFQRAPATTFGKVKEATIMKLWQNNRRLCAGLLANEFDPERMTNFVAQSTEPAAIQYVGDALVDVQEESGDLPPAELADILAIHKTVIDSLHSAAKRRPAGL